jgi:hypothetical protein
MLAFSILIAARLVDINISGHPVHTILQVNTKIFENAHDSKYHMGNPQKKSARARQLSAAPRPALWQPIIQRILL